MHRLANCGRRYVIIEYDKQFKSQLRCIEIFRSVPLWVKMAQPLHELTTYPSGRTAKSSTNATSVRTGIPLAPFVSTPFSVS